MARPKLTFANLANLALVASISTSPLVACADLRIADVGDGGGANNPDGSPSDSDGGGIGNDGGTTPGTDGSMPPKGPFFYDATQKALQAKRIVGPATPQNSSGYCTTKQFMWKESDGTLHSWAADTKAVIDYGFKVIGTRSYFFPSDTYIAVDESTFTNQNVYRTDQPSTLAGSIPYSFNFVSTTDGVLRLDQTVNGIDVGGTKVRRWNATMMSTEDITATVLDTRQPPSSFVNDVLVIPGGVAAPFALWLVDVAKKTTTSVTFDGGLTLYQTEQAAGGLVIAYGRNGGIAAIRFYKNDADTASARLEVGDDVANRANYFSDGPSSGEHKFLAKITTWNSKVLYGGTYGIWSYDLVSGNLAPVQLAPGKAAMFPDIMCVIRDSNMLVYRNSGDTLGQVWAVPLPTLAL